MSSFMRFLICATYCTLGLIMLPLPRLLAQRPCHRDLIDFIIGGFCKDGKEQKKPRLRCSRGSVNFNKLIY